MRKLTYFLFLLSALSSEEKKIDRPISEEIYYHHFSKDRPNDPIELKSDVKVDSSIKVKLPWKFLVHGWKIPKISPWYDLGRAAYFHKGEYNIVYVEWSKPANQSYLMAVIDAMDVGKTFGKFIIHLSKNGVSLDDIHLLGHSLGSHMVGFAGKYVRDNLRKIGRITGLDPAGPFYEPNPLVNKSFLEKQEPKLLEKLLALNPAILQEKKYLAPEDSRLSKEDANFVDIIHTDATHYGILASIGHCDFFPNGGKPPQPGCKNKDNDTCSQVRSAEFFFESIDLNNFVAKECSSYEDFKNDKCKKGSTAAMGEHTDSKTRGIFFLKTKSAPPFGLGDK